MYIDVFKKQQIIYCYYFTLWLQVLHDDLWKSKPVARAGHFSTLKPTVLRNLKVFKAPVRESQHFNRWSPQCFANLVFVTTLCRKEGGSPHRNKLCRGSSIKIITHHCYVFFYYYTHTICIAIIFNRIIIYYTCIFVIF